MLTCCQGHDTKCMREQHQGIISGEATKKAAEDMFWWKKWIVKEKQETPSGHRDE